MANETSKECFGQNELDNKTLGRKINERWTSPAIFETAGHNPSQNITKLLEIELNEHWASLRRNGQYSLLVIHKIKLE